MIRDPSDGSVRHHSKPLETQPYASEKPLLDTTSEPGMASGLPTASAKPELQAKLERSREWLKGYHAKKAHGETDGQ